MILVHPIVLILEKVTDEEFRRLREMRLGKTFVKRKHFGRLMIPGEPENAYNDGPLEMPPSRMKE